jgi:4-oxalocrotonate tautomerase
MDSDLASQPRPPRHLIPQTPMPYVNIKVAARDKPITREQKQALAQGITDVIERVLAKRRESISIVLEELPADNWAEGGELVSELRKNAARKVKHG